MKLSPLELKKADFKRGFRGFNKEEVRNLLASAAETLEELIKENKEFKERLIKLEERVKNFEDMEKTINATLVTAQKASESARQSAEREAELNVAKAEVQAEKILEDARAELNMLKREIEMQGHEKNAYLVKMRSLVASQWKLLQDEKIGEPVVAESAVSAEPVDESVREESEKGGVVEEELGEAQTEEEEEAAAEPEEKEQAEEKGPEGDFSKKLGEILKSDSAEAEQEPAEEDEPQAGEQDKEQLLWEEDMKAEELEQPEQTQQEEKEEEETDKFGSDDKAGGEEPDEEDEAEKGGEDKK